MSNEATGDRIVVLVRHGIAEDRVAGKTDEERSLTDEGHEKMREGARGLERAFPKAEVIISSPLVRAVQTAQWVAKAYGSSLELQTTDALVPGATPADLRKFLATLDSSRIILVGHEPNLSTNALKLAALSGSLDLQKGGAIAVRLGVDGVGSLEWMMTPKLLRKLG